MTKTIQTFVVPALVAFATLAFAMPAFGAVNLQDLGFKVNGKTSDTIQAGDDFEVTVNADVNDGDEVEFFRVRLKDSSNAVVSTFCSAVGRVRDINDNNIYIDVETPKDLPNGAYKVELLPFGIEGEEQSNRCDLDNDYPGSEKTYTGRLFVDSNEDIEGNDNDNNHGGSNSNDSDSNNGGNGGSSNGQVDQLDELIALIKAMLAGDTKPDTSALCTKFANLKAGGMYGVNTGVNTQGNAALQSFLMEHGQVIPALTQGVAPGFWGPQTQGAVNGFAAVNSCN